MINIGIISDVSWDNYILINNKMKKFDSETFRIHVIYSKNLQMLSNCAYNNNLMLNRTSGKTLSACISNLLNVCDMWLIFTNYVEYLTTPSLIISKCNDYSIKYVIISEYSRNDDFYSFEKLSSFKKTIKNLEKCKNKNNVEEFNCNYYNLNYESVKLTLNLTPDIINKLKQNYSNINKSRKDNSIKLLYDKDQLKLNKQRKKSTKELNSMLYANNRLNYYNN